MQVGRWGGHSDNFLTAHIDMKNTSSMENLKTSKIYKKSLFC